LDVATAFLNSKGNDHDIYMTLPEGWTEGLNAPTIIVVLKKALYGLKQAPLLWHNVINTVLLSLKFTQSQADPNLYLRSDGILMLLYIDDISMLYPQDATNAAIDVKARLTRSPIMAWHTNSSASNSTARKTKPAPASVLARGPSSPRFSNDSTCRMLMMYQLQWILM
jgi:hypothetical protein